MIVNSIAGLIIVLRPYGSVESVNDQSLRYFGYDFLEHQKLQTNNIIHPEDLDRGVGPGLTLFFRAEDFDQRQKAQQPRDDYFTSRARLRLR